MSIVDTNNKLEEKKQPIELYSNDSDRPNIESNSSMNDKEVIKKLEVNIETSNDVTLPGVSTAEIKETLEEKIINLQYTKCGVKEQLLELSSSTSENLNLKRNSSEKDERVIKKAKVSSDILHTTSNGVTLSGISIDNTKESPEENICKLQGNKCVLKKQLLELSSNTAVQPNLKRNSSEKDEKVIKKPKVSSEVSVSNTNDVDLPVVSVKEINDIPEIEIEVTHDPNTNELDQYNAPSFKSPKSWYTSDTINDYLKLIVKRSNGEVHAVVTDFIPAYLRGGYPAVRRWIKKDIHSLKLLFVPMNVGGHWILTVVNVPERTVTSYDSLKSYNGPYPMVLKEYLTDWEMDKKGAASSWTLKIGETTRQTNGYDCGPFTVELAEKMARGDTTPINASLMPSVRLRHREEIIAGQLFQ
ncbi:uncharacterized protein LOC126908301 [Daktulosphaira vitifoliae]|uniref:uncharacterized protein LOC126908301 n=1 Tax=Daktulosphaira vitifoliae TaxID=58002 RepID=UPI0021AA4CF3|nr:uncharacterized protein LOC126908301 [Daktulosphaira vitifoliae]